MRETGALGRRCLLNKKPGEHHLAVFTIHPFKHPRCPGAGTALGGCKAQATCSPPKSEKSIGKEEISNSDLSTGMSWSVCISTVPPVT